MMVRHSKEELKNGSETNGWSHLSDERLLATYQDATQAGRADQAGMFAELVSRYERELYNYLRRYLGDGALAEDVFQTTFLQVHLKCGQFESGRKFRPWLYTIATNQAIDAQRRNRRHKRLSLDVAHSASGEEVGSLLDMVAAQESNPFDSVDSGERADWVRNEVAALPDPLQNAVNLVYFRGMKYRDAARVMSVPVGTVKSRLHSAIKKLAQSWHEFQVTSQR
jgi:RNA polymerase sigma-70 factor, ECF subfamily